MDADQDPAFLRRYWRRLLAMDALNFRTMEKADLATVVKIENDCQSHPWSLMQFLEGIDAGHSGWVVYREFEGNEVMVGFAVVSTVLDESTLLNICVRPAFQNQGVGRQVIEFLLQHAAGEHIRRYFLEVRASNRIAIRLYESLGFRQLSVRKSYYPAVVGREDGLVYGFEMSSPDSA